MSNKKCVREKYLYLSAMLRAREAKMLTREKAERMIEAPSFADAAAMLCDCGYADMSDMSAKELEKALAEHRAEIFSELARMSPDKELVDVFRMKYDYHNAKTIIKAEAGELDRADLLSSSGRVDPEILIKAFTEDNFRNIPDVMGKAAAEAKSTLARTSNPQLADFTLDRAYFEELLSSAKALGSSFIKGYAQILIDSANLRSAVRTLRMKKSGDFLRTALIPGGGTDVNRVMTVATDGDSLAALYANTLLEEAARLGAAAASGGRMTDFELACDNAVTAYLGKAKLVAFGEAPVIAYIAAVENEITAVRMILTGFLAGIRPETIKERLRDFYA